MPIFTAHDTVFYVGRDRSLRHGPARPGRRTELTVVSEGERVRLFETDGRETRPIVFGGDGIGRSSPVNDEATPFVREFTDGDKFVLRDKGLYLSATPERKLSLRTATPRSWETFQTAELPGNRELRVAAFTMVYNEPIFLPLWFRHYGSHLGPENLFVVDHGSTDSSVKESGARNVIHLPRDDFDENVRLNFVASFQNALLQYYDIVIFADVDEMIVPHPEKFSDLIDYAGARCENFVTCMGLDVVHFPNRESEFDPMVPVLCQRGHVRFNAEYCKPLISEVPLNWTTGFHACEFAPRLDPDLYLFHLKLFDRDIALNNLHKSRAVSLSKHALSEGQALQWQLEDDVFLDTYWPGSLEEASPTRDGEFTFNKDLGKYETRHPRMYQNFVGGFHLVPAAFRTAIRSTDGE